MPKFMSSGSLSNQSRIQTNIEAVRASVEEFLITSGIRYNNLKMIAYEMQMAQGPNSANYPRRFNYDKWSTEMDANEGDFWRKTTLSG